MIQMNDWTGWAAALLAGALSGVFFFGGLWITVSKGIRLRNPSLLFLASSIVRTAVTLAVFYYVSDGSWQRIVTCLAGFLFARFLVARYTGSSGTSQRNTAEP